MLTTQCHVKSALLKTTSTKKPSVYSFQSEEAMPLHIFPAQIFVTLLTQPDLGYTATFSIVEDMDVHLQSHITGASKRSKSSSYNLELTQ